MFTKEHLRNSVEPDLSFMRRMPQIYFGTLLKRVASSCNVERAFKGPVLAACPHSTSTAATHSDDEVRKIVPRTLAEHNYMRSLKPSQPNNPKLLRVAIVGLPNVGKSTLINHLIQWKIRPVSKRVHTTRQNARALLTEGDTQIVFLDTPGVVDLDHSRKHSLEATMVVGPEHSLTNADVVGVMVDASDHWRRDKIDSNILKLLCFHRDKHSFLILNKVDTLRSKRQLLESIHSLTDGIVDGYPTYRKKQRKRKELDVEELFARAMAAKERELDKGTCFPESSSGGWPHFKRVFIISALNDDGVKDIRDYLLDSAKPHEWMFPRQLVTDQNPHEIAITTVKSKLLDHLSKEVPYNLDVKISTWDIDSAGVLHAAFLIKGTSDRHIKNVIGEEGKIIRQIASETRQELANTFHCEVSLKLLVNKAD